jgi:hypothetical protein
MATPDSNYELQKLKKSQVLVFPFIWLNDLKWSDHRKSFFFSFKISTFAAL